jgi:hypothetical protein
MIVPVKADAFLSGPEAPCQTIFTGVRGRAVEPIPVEPIVERILNCSRRFRLEVPEHLRVTTTKNAAVRPLSPWNCWKGRRSDSACHAQCPRVGARRKTAAG